MTPACDVCPVAAARARASLGAHTVECVCGRVHRARVVRVYQADPDAPAAHRSALDRAGHAARVADDPELARVRRVLAELRPDCPDPMQPPATAAVEAVVDVRIRETRAPWDMDLPAGMASGAQALHVAWAMQTGTPAADVLRDIAALPPDAAAVLRWMRSHGVLDKGIRGLYVDAAMALSGADDLAAWRDLNELRSHAPKAGKRLVLRACEAWERSHARTPAHPAP